MKYCIDCKHFADAHYSKTCISPRCKQRGDDDCAYMRQVVCGIEGELYEPNTMTRNQARAALYRLTETKSLWVVEQPGKPIVRKLIEHATGSIRLERTESP